MVDMKNGTMFLLDLIDARSRKFPAHAGTKTFYGALTW